MCLKTRGPYSYLAVSISSCFGLEDLIEIKVSGSPVQTSETVPTHSPSVGQLLRHSSRFRRPPDDLLIESRSLNLRKEECNRLGIIVLIHTFLSFCMI